MGGVRRLVSGPLLLVVVAVAVALPLLLLNNGDGSYSCRAGAIADVVHPEPQASATFRQNFFDSGWQCNHQARQQVSAAGVVLLLGAGTAGVWARRRRREQGGDRPAGRNRRTP